MSRLLWDAVGQKIYETGTKNGVLYLLDTATATYPEGVAWNGLTAVSESPSGAESNPLYADDIKYVDLRSAEEFGATIEAYTYPDEFAECDGSKELAPGVLIGQQARRTFGLSYRTTVGNDTSGESYGYKLHLIYGATVSPSEKSYQTINDSPEAITFSWEMTTSPVPVTAIANAKPTASITIDSTKTTPEKMAAIEAILYGTDAGSGTEGTTARLPLPDEVYTLMSA